MSTYDNWLTTTPEDEDNARGAAESRNYKDIDDCCMGIGLGAPEYVSYEGKVWKVIRRGSYGIRANRGKGRDYEIKTLPTNTPIHHK